MSMLPVVRAMGVIGGDLQTGSAVLYLDLYPIHMSGASVFIYNASDTVTSEIYIEESFNGTVWNPILFYTPYKGQVLEVDITPHGQIMLTINSGAKHVRLRMQEQNPGGLFINIVEFPPMGVPGAPGVTS